MWHVAEAFWARGEVLVSNSLLAYFGFARGNVTRYVALFLFSCCPPC